MSFTLFFDGCSKGNPGVAGCGAVIYNSDGAEIWSIAKFVGDKCTNNYAEYMGLICGLEEVYNRQIGDLLVKGDSQLVIRQMKGEYKVKSDNLFDVYNKASTLSKNFGKIQFQHVYRNDNKRADLLSNLALNN